MYTNAWVADLMLDLVGYTDDQDLAADTIVEPGCGDGAFLRRIIPRLMRSVERQGHDVRTLRGAIEAYELDPASVSSARARVVEILSEHGLTGSDARDLANRWVIQGDFLLRPTYRSVRWVVGNPPYVRVEDSSPDTYAEYRGRWKTMSGRADVYIGFYEAGLSMLRSGGQLCFICADRWMHNQYGAGLRRHIVENFALSALIEVHDADVFDVPVTAYPAITLVERSAHSATALATASAMFEEGGAARLSQWISSVERDPVSDPQFSASVLEGKFGAEGSWPSGPPERLRMIADLEDRYPSLTEVGVSIGVGMATGADKVYVVGTPVDVERRFLKKAIGPADLQNGSIVWQGRYIVSPWDGEQLADRPAFPKLKAYFELHAERLKARYVGVKFPQSWWRTIDRPQGERFDSPKLIVADINDRIEPVLDREGYWPLHSAYFITSSEWDLEVLGGYLLSETAGAFVEAYSVKMANGHLRVSAQYLKRIRLPVYGDVPVEVRSALAEAFRHRDRDLASSAVSSLLSPR